MYARYVKRPLDFLIALFALIVLSPMLLILIIVGAIAMKGNPFFIQVRPGKDEKLFNMIKFRSMTCAKGNDGNLLPDEMRLTKYGTFLRKSSLDELMELINVIKADMSLIGPRPLQVQYLPYYTEEERRRHSVRPGISGLAQVNGRNAASWEERFSNDLKYVDNITFINDMKIVFLTIAVVLSRKDIVVRSADGSMDFDQYRRIQIQLEEKSKYDCDKKKEEDFITRS